MYTQQQKSSLSGDQSAFEGLHPPRVSAARDRLKENSHWILGRLNSTSSSSITFF
jgi:hypothetical protein